MLRLGPVCMCGEAAAASKSRREKPPGPSFVSRSLFCRVGTKAPICRLRWAAADVTETEESQCRWRRAVVEEHPPWRVDVT